MTTNCIVSLVYLCLLHKDSSIVDNKLLSSYFLIRFCNILLLKNCIMKISLAYFSFSALLYSTTSVVLNLRRNKICRPQMTAQTPISTKESYAFRVDKLSRNLLLTSLIAVSQSSRPVNAYSELDPSLQ